MPLRMSRPRIAGPASDITDVILAADRRVRARLAAKHIVRRRRKLAGVDASTVSTSRCCASARTFGRSSSERKQPDHPLRPLEGEIGRFAERPAPAQMTVEALLGAEPVDRQLQRARLVGRPAKLVVDHTERAVGEQVDAIRFAAERQAARSRRRIEREVALRAGARAAGRPPAPAARPPCGRPPRQGRRPPANRAIASARAPPRCPRSVRSAALDDVAKHRRAPSSRVSGVID